MPHVEYSLDDEGRMTVENDTAHWYRHLDLTSQAESLFRFIERTIDAELVEELAFLAQYDGTKKAIQDIVDMPDRQIDLFIRFCLQNNGRLASPQTRESLRFALRGGSDLDGASSATGLTPALARSTSERSEGEDQRGNGGGRIASRRQPSSPDFSGTRRSIPKPY